MAHNTCTCGSGLQNMAVLAVCHGRELSELLAELRAVSIGDLPQANLNALLKRLEVGEVTDERDLVALEALSKGLENILAQEVVGTATQPFSIGYDEDGEIWELREVPLYSDRGERTIRVYEHLECFLDIRQRLIDIANAQRLAARLLQ